MSGTGESAVRTRLLRRVARIVVALCGRCGVKELKKIIS